MPPSAAIIALIVVAAALLLFVLLLFFIGYKKCPSDKVMVIYGKVGKNADGSNKSCKCIHGGAAYIVPFLQAYAFLDLSPITVEIDLPEVLTKDDVTLQIAVRAAVGASTDEALMINAAERLLNLSQNEIKEMCTDILESQTRLLISEKDSAEIKAHRQRLATDLHDLLSSVCDQIGIRIINLNLSKIQA